MQNQFSRVGAASLLISVSIFGLAACGDKSSSLAARDHAAPGSLSESSDGSVQQASAPIRLSRPRTDNGAASAASDIAWASSKSASGAENAEARFQRYGGEFDAANADAYAAQARAFLRRPPSGAQTIARVNGDKLVYDAKSNVFAVADSEGLPRTFFHPRDGATYWDQQKAIEAKRTDSGGSSRSSSAREG